MQVAPSRSSRSDAILQPSYFTSSLYVSAVRDDISGLVLAFHQEWTGVGCPFTVFKQIWQSQGWTWLTLMAFDDRARLVFLNVTCRLFLERMAKTEPPLVRVLGLYALYTFFHSQPENPAPPLLALNHITIPVDQYKSLLSLPGTLNTPHLQPFQNTAAQLLANLIDQSVFMLLPSSELKAQAPSVLPRVMVGPHLERPSTKKAGRPSKRDQAVRARNAVDTLDSLLEQDVTMLPMGNEEHAEEYERVLSVVDSVAVSAAQQHVQRRLRELETMSTL